MALHSRFTANAPAVVYEEFDNEVVVIHLNKGAYYSLESGGALVWRALQTGASPSEIAAAIQAQHPNAEEVNQAVSGFLAELQAEELVRPVSDAPTDARPALPSFPAWSPPVLQKYTDMQDLLLLDPIHEVDEKGWPHAAG